MEPIIIALAAYEVHARAVEFLRRRRQIKFAEAPAILAQNGNEIPLGTCTVDAKNAHI
jgi:hypothetical protein